MEEEKQDKEQFRKGRTVVDPETGEVFEGVQIRTAKQDKAYKHIKQVEYERGKEFTFDDMGNYRELMEDIGMGKKNLSGTQLGYWYFIKTFAGNDGFVRPSREQQPITTITDMVDLLEVSWPTASNNINALLDNDLLLKEEYIFENGKEKKAFKINNKYSYRGEQKDIRTVKSFNKTIREIYRQNGADSLSFLVPLIGYIGMEDNVIVFNPYEKDARKLEPMNIEDMADITGFSTGKVSNRINNLMHNDLHVFATMKKGTKKMYIVNPLAVYRKQGMPPKTLIRQFKI